MTELVAIEKARLAELEVVVDRGLQTFYEVGSALLEIREHRLYRETHETFQAYCQERFGFSDSRGRQLIAAARTVTAVTQQGLPAPKTEREARELARQLRTHADELDGGALNKHLAAAKSYLDHGEEMRQLALSHLAEARALLHEVPAADGTEQELAEAGRLLREVDALEKLLSSPPFASEIAAVPS